MDRTSRAHVRRTAFAAGMVLLLLGGAAIASAQQQTGTLTGTIVNDSGAVVPGVSVAATEVATGVVRSAVSDAQGAFRMAALPPGRYTVKVELTGFSPVSMVDINLQTSEVRDLGKLVMKVGSQAGGDHGHRGSDPGADRDQRPDLGDHQRPAHEHPDEGPGRVRHAGDPARRAGHQPQSRFHDLDLMRDVTINGNPVTNKNVMVDGISIVDEGGAGNASSTRTSMRSARSRSSRTGSPPRTAATTAANEHGHQVRHEHVQGSGGDNARRDRWNENDYLREVQGQPKPLYRVNITGYSIGGPVVIPKLFDTRNSNKKVYFFASKEDTDDARPSKRSGSTCRRSSSGAVISRRRARPTAPSCRSSTRSPDASSPAT